MAPKTTSNPASKLLSTVDTLIFGGRFDPPHLGHLEALEGVVRDLRPRRVLVLPTGRAGHKPCVASGTQRIEMLKLVLAASTDRALKQVVQIDDREIRRADRVPTDPTYSYDTLLELGQAYGGPSSLGFVIGVDQLEGLTRWHRFPEVLALSHWIVLERAPDGSQRALKAIEALVAGGILRPQGDRSFTLTGAAAHLLLLPTDARALSSTEIRQAITLRGEAPDGALPPALAQYMKQCRIY